MQIKCPYTFGAIVFILISQIVFYFIYNMNTI